MPKLSDTQQSTKRNHRPTRTRKPRSATKPFNRSNGKASKRQDLVRLLSRRRGASAQELQEALGWLPHTVRAAITGLRRKGYIIDRSRGEDGFSIYRIVGKADDSAKAQADA